MTIELALLLLLSQNPSQPPSPSRGNQGGSEPQQTEAAKPTPKLVEPDISRPIAPQIVPNTQVVKIDEGAQQQGGFYGTLADWAMVLVTLGALVATFGLFITTRNQNITQNRHTLDALALARSDAVLTHRPKLIVRNVVVDGLGPTGVEADRISNTRLWLTNVGLTAAIVQAVFTEWVQADNLPMENPINRRVSEDTTQTPVTLEAGAIKVIRHEDKVVDFSLHYSIGNSAEGAHERKEVRHTLWLIGAVKYTDREGLFLRHTFFCREYMPKEVRFEPVDNSDYEYAD